jgi:hypothetical protein
VQCDCIVTQLYHEVFKFDYCSVLGLYLSCCNNKHVVFELKFALFTPDVEILLRMSAEI